MCIIEDKHFLTSLIPIGHYFDYAYIYAFKFEKCKKSFPLKKSFYTLRANWKPTKPVRPTDACLGETRKNENAYFLSP